MTVIAYRDGVMAGDSCWSYGEGDENIYAGLIFNEQSKIKKLKCGALYGGSGAVDDRELISILDGGILPTAKWLQTCQHDNITALLVMPDLTIWRVYTGEGRGGVEPVKLPYAAVGSGAAIAIGAMWTGASAKKAVLAACNHNVYCRPPIHTISFETIH